MFGQSQTNHHEGPSRVCLGQSGRTEEACTPLAPCSASNSTFWPSCSSCGITGRNSAVRDFSEPVRAAPKDLGGHAAQTWSKGRRSHPIEDSAPPSAGHAGVSYWPRGRWLGDCSQRDPVTAQCGSHSAISEGHFWFECRRLLKMTPARLRAGVTWACIMAQTVHSRRTEKIMKPRSCPTGSSGSLLMDFSQLRPVTSGPAGRGALHAAPRT